MAPVGDPDETPIMRALILTLHRWIGLPASVILAITGGTGVLLVWPMANVVGRIAGRLHETIGLGRAGALIVTAATGVAVLLELSGLYLWWKRKALAIHRRGGWQRIMFDLHHAAGAVGFVIMLLIASAAITARFLPVGPMRRAANELHTGHNFSTPIKVVYALGSLGFAVQGTTGVLMWLRRSRGVK